MRRRACHRWDISPILLALVLAGCGRVRPQADLLITGASLFDTRVGEVTAGMSVAIQGRRIRAVGRDEELAGTRAVRVLDARGRLLTPGFMDAHAHSVNVLATAFNAGGGGLADLSMRPDSIAAYRQRFADAYLPFGVTVIRDAGTNEDHLPLQLSWMSPDPGFPDFLPCGGALVSSEVGRVPYPGHRAVSDSAEAVAVVARNRDVGFGYVKLYWRLRGPEFRAALAEAQRSGLVPFAHVDFGVVSYDRALEIGLRHFEHLSTLPVQRLGPDVVNRITMGAINEILGGDRRGAFFMAVMEAFNEIGEGDVEMLALIRRMAEKEATLTPTLHVLARPLGLTYLDPDPVGLFDDTSSWTPEQLERARAGFRVALSYVAALNEAGVAMAVGTDTVDPGASVLSELLLLHEAGIPMAQVLKMATLGTAEVLEQEEEYGSIEVGRRAHLLLFEENPLDDPRGLLARKTIVKDGRIHEFSDT